MDYQIYLQNSKKEKLDLLCEPFNLERDVLNDGYKFSYSEINNYQKSVNVETKIFSKQSLNLQGYNTYDVIYDIQRFVLSEDELFRLYYVDKNGVEYFSQIVISDCTTMRIVDDLFNIELNIDRVTNWYLKETLSSGSGNNNLPKNYNYTYNFTYTGLGTTLNNNSIAFEVNGDESAIWELLLKDGCVNPKWSLYNGNKILYSGELYGTFNKSVVVSNLSDNFGIWFENVDIRNSRNYNKETWFTLPRGMSVISVDGVPDYDFIIYHQLRSLPL